MRTFRWSAEKNDLLRTERGVTFEEVVVAIEGGGLLDQIDHQDQTRYPDQKIMVVMLNSYVHLVPYVEDDEQVFLKTVIPSRKATKTYLRGKEGPK